MMNKNECKRFSIVGKPAKMHNLTEWYKTNGIDIFEARKQVKAINEIQWAALFR